MADTTSRGEPRFLVDPYLDWLEREGVTVIEDFCVDLNAAETKAWPRLGVDGAAVHMRGRGDFMSLFIIDLPPGGKMAPQHHLYEEVFYVLSGHGTVVVENADGRSHSFEWGPRSLFALPLNAPYRMFNGSGIDRARIVSSNNFCMMMNALRNEQFIFENPFRFKEREGREGHLAGEGDLVPSYSGRPMWETNFVPDMGSFALGERKTRGAESGNMVFILAEGTMHAHCSEMPVGTYKQAHRHDADFHVFIVAGQGYSLFWYEGETEFRRYDWHDGCVFAPTDMLFHQHFTTGPTPVRYMATAYGSGRYPFSESKKRIKMGLDLGVKQGGSQIQYADQNPRIHQLYLEELRKNGVDCRMGQFLDEKILLGEKV